MPEPTPTPTTTTVQTQREEAQSESLRDIIRQYAGWYPRWWLLAAFLCTFTIVAGMLTWDGLLCPSARISSNDALICHVPNVPYLLQILLIWLLFGLLWLLIFTFGFKLAELPTDQPGTLGRILHACTAFEPLYPALLAQGAISWLLINIMWWRDNSPPIPFALLAISVFIAHCSLFHHSPPARHRLYLSTYGLLCLLLLLAEVLFKRNFQAHLGDEWLLLTIEILLVFVGIGAIFWRSQPTRPTRHQLPASMNASISPLTVLSSLWPFNHLFPPQR
ncbi:hypothetical protein KSD_91850 [Ktedonobacter sp. SOSP1-85]|uniref:hypothetical protein n=1 Tax=Ktedonobacter sp. SOSP1-85 TaxID=2778367 RepID=UPI001915BEFA|nr:hypothetical protein [Ktedonobacter sp. SOSP1-85]GHO81414.1 hypothetical protein KSD_91850 [Ktedonobacter sp. SOSP1-85]